MTAECVFCFFIFQLHHAIWDVCNKKTGHSEAGSLSDRPPFKYHFFSSSPPSFVSPGDIASNFRAGKRAPCRWTKDITKHSLPSTANPHRSQGKHFIRRIIDWIQSFMFFPKVFTDFILEMGKKKLKFNLDTSSWSVPFFVFIRLHCAKKKKKSKTWKNNKSKRVQTHNAYSS